MSATHDSMDQAPVFISYSRKQFYVAEYLAHALEQQGLAIWLDVQNILPGVEWQASIDEYTTKPLAYSSVLVQSPVLSFVLPRLPFR